MTLQITNNFYRKTTMALIEIFRNFFNKKTINFIFLRLNKSKVENFKYLILLSFSVLFTIVYFAFSNIINQKNENNLENLNVVANSSEFSKLTEYFISKINSPYEEIKYKIKNKDSVGRILNKYSIKETEINQIVTKLKEKKLSNIYTGRELKLVIKNENQLNSVINLIFPINNTSSVEIRKLNDSFLVKENIIKLNKKEVVVKSKIKNNLYSSAVNAGIEPNIIVEFARVFGFEVDFQRDIREGDWFEILYEKFEDDNNKIRDTGKIIYASMYVNREEINLYNFEYNKFEEYYDIRGKSITKSLMKTPINGARLSSLV